MEEKVQDRIINQGKVNNKHNIFDGKVRPIVLESMYDSNMVSREGRLHTVCLSSLVGAQTLWIEIDPP